MRFSYIRDDDGVLDFSTYFDYLDQISGAMPDSLREFALSPGSYFLTGGGTLHDARLVAFSAEKSHVDDSKLRLNVGFVHQSYEKRIFLVYGDVSSFYFDHECLFRSPGIDAISHEFSLVGHGAFRHKVIFDGGLGFWVDFEGFSCAFEPMNGHDQGAGFSAEFE